MTVITRCSVIERIEGINVADRSSAYRIIFEDESFAYIPANHIREFAAFFGCEDGTGLQGAIRGQKIVYCVTLKGEFKGFTPIEDWDGPEIDEGQFLINRDCDGEDR